LLSELSKVQRLPGGPGIPYNRKTRPAGFKVSHQRPTKKRWEKKKNAGEEKPGKKWWEEKEKAGRKKSGPA